MSPLHNFGRAKVVVTYGPAIADPHRLEEVVRAGADVLRLNFSHGTRADHARAIAEARRLAERLDIPLAILQDLQGPRIRTGPLAGGGPVELRAGQPLTPRPRRATTGTPCPARSDTRAPSRR